MTDGSRTAAEEIRSLRTSIADLQSSTSLLEAQAAALESHHQSRRERVENEPSCLPKDASRGPDTILQEARNAILTEQREMSISAQRSVRDLVNSTTRMLARHDQVLSGLNDAAPIPINVAEMADQLEDLHRALERSHSDLVHTRLQRNLINSTASEANEKSSAHDNPALQQRRAIAQDLELLCAEIPDICKMLVYQQHRASLDVALKGVREADETLQAQSYQRESHIISTMADQLNSIADLVETVHSHRLLLHRMDEHFRSATKSEGTPFEGVHRGEKSISSAARSALSQFLGMDSKTPAISDGDTVAADIQTMSGLIMDSISTSQMCQAQVQGNTIKVDENKALLQSVDELIARIDARLER